MVAWACQAESWLDVTVHDEERGVDSIHRSPPVPCGEASWMNLRHAYDTTRGSALDMSGGIAESGQKNCSDDPREEL